MTLTRFSSIALITLGWFGIAAHESCAEDFPELFNTQEETEQFPTPQQSLARVTVPDGFEVSLFAAEPDVQQPIAMATDERGRLWVAENYTYAERPTNFESKVKDRIIILDDTDGDGQFDKRTVFWDEASKLTSIEIGFGGVWALCAPNLLFIPDRNGDDVPDGKPVVLLNGWNDDSIRHNIVNGLRWGPDGWLYGRHGIAGTSTVGTPETAPEHREQVDCAIWRYHPTRKAFEVVCRGTTNPWGMDWDEHGQMFFINTVIGHLWHVIPGAYYQRMYGEHFDSNVYQLLGQTADHYHWDTREAWSDIRKLGVTPTTDQAGGGHAHCGMMIYQGENWPAEYRNKIFTCNLHGLRVNCDRIERSGATYVGKHEPDFLRSTDPWFRGIELVSGHDGGVYVCDWSDIGECHENDGIHRTSGRIFKITHGKQRRADDLNELPNEDLIKLQRHNEEWLVRKARRLLQQRAAAGQDMTQVHQAFHRLFDRQRDVRKVLRAMWALYVTGGTSESWLREQLDHHQEHVRVWAVRLLADQETISEETRLAFVKAAGGESSGLVLTFLASALQRLEHEHRWELARKLANKSRLNDDPVFPLMVWYGIEPAVAEFPDQALAFMEKGSLSVLSEFIARRLTNEIERQPQAVEKLVAQMDSSPFPDVRRSTLRGMEAALRGWRKAPAPDGWAKVRDGLLKSEDKETQRLARELAIVFGDGRALDELRKTATSGSELDARQAAIRTLVAARDESIVAHLQKLITHRDLGVEAIRGLAAFADSETPKLLIENYNSQSRDWGRRESIATLTARPEYAKQLLEAIAAGKIDHDAVSPFQLRQLQLHGDPEIDRLVDRLWPDLKSLSAEKQKRIAEFREQLTPGELARADLSQGRAVYNQNCGKCHRLFGTGGKLGPDLTGAQRHNLNYLLENILDPSATVSKNFHLSIALLEDGRVVSGIVVAENERTITIQAINERLILLRDEIEELRPSKLSMMPERQLEAMKPNQVRDLIGYLMSPSQVPLPNDRAAK